MSLSSDIKANNKKKNSNATKMLIKNQKAVNIIKIILLTTLIISDLIYLIKENYIGISQFTYMFLIISLIVEGVIFLGLLLLKFNSENFVLKIISIVVFSLPLIAYMPMMGYGDGFSILLFILRLLLVMGLIYVISKSKEYPTAKSIRGKQIAYSVMALALFVVTMVLLISNQTRRVLYSYDDDLEGYVATNVLNGSSDVEIKEGAVKIADNSLKNTGKSITLSSTVKYVSKNAFIDSEIEEVYLNSLNISIAEALNNSNVEKVYLNNSNISITDIDKIDRTSTLKFIASKEDIDNYRAKYREYDYFFAPKTDEGEYYLAYNSTTLPVEYYHLNDVVNEPKIESTETSKLYGFRYTYLTFDNITGKIFPLTIKESTDITCIWATLHKIRFDYDGGSIVNPTEEFVNKPEEIRVMAEDGNLVLPTLEKEGYRFDGWYNSIDNTQEIIENNLLVASKIRDMLLKAKFSVSYKLIYHLNGGRFTNEETSQEYYDGDEITPATPIRDGYTFIGWYSDSEFTSARIDKVNAAGTELYAKWELVTYNVDYSLDGGSHENKKYTSTVEDGYEFMDAYKMGYEFLGWYSDSEFNNRIYTTSDIFEDTTLYAKFVPNEYVINYDLNGGTASESSLNVTFDSSYELIDATKLGYKFLGWYYNDSLFENGIYKFDHDITLVARYELLNPVITLSNDVNKVFDNNEETISISIDHDLKDAQGFAISYKWYVLGNDSIISTKKDIKVLEAQNNKYYCHIKISYLEDVIELDSDYINVNIEKAEYDLSNIDFDVFTFEFNGKNQVPSITNLPVGLDGIKLFATYNQNGSFLNVGDSGTVTATFSTSSKNYKVPESVKAFVSIVSKTLTVKYDSLSHIYDGTDWKPTLELEGLIDGYNATLSTNSIQSIDAGLYHLALNISDNEHYVLDDDSIDYSILKAEYDLSNITFDTTVFQFDGAYHVPNPINLPNGLELGNNDGLRNVCDNQEIILYLFNNNSKNYYDPEPIKVMMSITPKAITANILNTSFVYNGSDQKPEVTLVGIIDNDSVFGVINNESIDYGTYTILPELIGANANNYFVDNYVSYVITKATYDLSNVTFSNSTFTYDGTYHLPLVNNLPDGLALGDNIGLKDVCSNETISIKLVNNNPNYYDQTDLSTTITINPKSIKANLVNNSFVYNKNIHELDIELLDVIDDDIVSAKANNNEFINVGTYNVTLELEGINANNYLIDYSNSDLAFEITKASFENECNYVFKEETIYTYDGNSHKPSLDLSVSDKKYYTNYSHLIEYEFLIEQSNIYSYDMPSNAGTYDILVRFYVSNGNYNDITKTCRLVIEKKEITLEFDSLSFQYDNGNNFIPVVINYIGLISGDDLTIEVNNTNIKTRNDEGYVLTFDYYGKDKDNYIVNQEYRAFVYGTQIEISNFTVIDYNGVYDGLNHTVTVEGLPDNITYSVDKNPKYVGTYVVNITFKSSDPNEGVSTTATGIVKITEKPVSIEFDNSTLIYNGEVQIPVAKEITGVVQGDSVNVIISNESRNVGTYNATVSLDNSNYKISNSDSLTYTIDPCYVTLEWGSKALVYSKSILKPTAWVRYGNNILDTEVLVVTGNNINVGGPYTATAIVTDENYIIDGENTTEYTIVPKGVSLNWSNLLLPYDGNQLVPEATVSITNDNCNVIITVEGDHKAPGTYTAVAELDNDNYKIEGNNYRSYIISNGVIDNVNEVEALTEVTYDGTAKTPTIKNENIYTSDGSLVLHRLDKSYIKAGSYYVDVIFYTSNGYYDEYTVTVALVINQLELDITLNETELRYQNKVVVPTFTINNKVESDDLTVAIDTRSEAIGEYKANFNLSGLDKANYKITNIYKYTIIKGILDMSDVEFVNTDVIYNGNQQLPKANNLPEGVSIDTINSIGVIDVFDTLATIKYVLTGDALINYECPDDINVNMTVSKKTITINWTKVEFGYDGNSHRPEYELVGLEGNDIANLIFTSVDGINRGVYEAIISGIDNDNYYVEETTVSYEITYGTYDLSNITVQNKTFTYDGNVHKAIAIEGTLPSGVEVSYEYDKEVIYAGTHTATIKFSGDENNYYAIPDMTAYVIINPKPVKVTWTNTSLTYNGYYQNPTASITGDLISGDVCDIQVNGSQKNAGTYIATAELSNSNYVASIVEQEYTISPKTINVTIACDGNVGTSFTYAYDGKVHNNITAEYNYSNLIGNDDLIITVNTSNIRANAGSYSYSLSFSNSNYVANTMEGIVTIKALSLSDTDITWVARSYGLYEATYKLSSYTYYSCINYNETISMDDLSVEYIYYSYTYRWATSTYVRLDGEPTVAGDYVVTVNSTNTDNITISHSSVWNYKEITYVPPVTKEIWSYDEQFNSNLFTATGNQSNTKATFTIDGESVEFNKGLKLETGDGVITFTITTDKKMTIYYTTSSSKYSFDINGKSTTIASGEAIELTAGNYTIKKSNGSITVYAIVLE